MLIGFLISCKKSERAETPAQATAIHYLYLPALICDTFSRQLWHHDLDFRGYDREENKLYFIARNSLSRKDMLTLLTLDTSLIEYAPCDTGLCEFGGMSGVIDGYYAFRIPTTNLRVDSDKVFQYKYYDTFLTITFRELSNELDSTYFYNSPKTVDLSSFFGKENYAANVGAFISHKDNDPVVKALALKITAGLKTNEEKAQALLRFVTNNIEYSYEDQWYETEITKRAHEVLLSGDGDCSAKTTLYASLLEQCDIPYCLLYYKNHINVGVEGNFKMENNYVHEVEKRKYAVAETTVENFVIGQSLLETPEVITKLLFYQIPRKSPDIIIAGTGEKLKFASFEE